MKPHMQDAWHGIQVLGKCQLSISSPVEETPRMCPFPENETQRFPQGKTEPRVLSASDAGNRAPLPVFEPLLGTRFRAGQPVIRDDEDLAPVLTQPQGESRKWVTTMRRGQMYKQRPIKGSR